MRRLISRTRVGVFLLVAMAGGMLANVAWPDVDVRLPGTNKCTIKVRPETPCGNPQSPANFFFRWPDDYAVGECTQVENWGGLPPNPRVYFGACYNGDDDVHYMVSALDGACAGGPPIEIEAAPVDLFASVGFPDASGIVPQGQMLRVSINRVVTPGPAADMVSATFLGGGLQTRTVRQGDQADVTLKLIVYPDLATANADPGGTGAGSAFFGKITLIGALGSLIPLQGFLAGDFLVQDDGGGMFTARPVEALQKIALVPDANAAVVSIVGDPRTSNDAPLDVGGDLPQGLALAPAKPNPSSGNVMFRFSLPQAGPASLEVFDLVGRRVRSWRWDGLPAGEHTVKWDGQTDAGTRAPAGTMLLRLSAMGKSITQKAMRLP